MTPQELINLPNAGQAEAQCVKDGHWEEDAGKEYTNWQVTVEGYVLESETIPVRARSEEEAYEEAAEEAEGIFDKYDGECYNAKEIK